MPDQEIATVITKGNRLGIGLIDGNIPCAKANYNMASLKNIPMPTKVRALPGRHELTFFYEIGGTYLAVSTNVLLSAGKSYAVSCHATGYSLSLSFEPESR